jgi:carbamoylphosphate synthase large subunit
VLDELFRDGRETARLRAANIEALRATGVRQGDVNVEIIFDPRGQVWLPINDDETIDRAVAMKSLPCLRSSS